MFFAQTHTREPDDDELLRRLRQTGQDSCFGTLYSRYIPLLYGVCLKYLQRQDLAEDAVMALFEELQPKIARYEIREFRTWIYSAAKNHCLQQLRKTKREIPHEPDARFMESAGITHLLDEPEAVSGNEPLKACLEELPEPQRISIRHFFFEEMSYADIAEATGWHLKSVKSYIQNGKRNLKICIEKRTER